MITPKPSPQVPLGSSHKSEFCKSCTKDVLFGHPRTDGRWRHRRAGILTHPCGNIGVFGSLWLNDGVSAAVGQWSSAAVSSVCSQHASRRWAIDFVPLLMSHKYMPHWTNAIPPSCFFRSLLYSCKRVLLQKMLQLTSQEYTGEYTQEYLWRDSRALLQLCAPGHIWRLQHCMEEHGEIV